MMNRTSKQIAILVYMLALVASGGCESGVRLGDWTLIKPSGPLGADRIEVLRRDLWQGRPIESSPAMTMVVDLAGGRASLTGQDGQRRPVELGPDLLEDLRAGIEGRSWQGSRRDPPKNTEHAVSYELVAFDQDKPVGGTARWHNPAAKALPASLQTVMTAFDRASRQVRPLSKSVNLIE